MRPAVILQLPVNPKLKELIGRAADADGLAMNEWVSKVCAKELGRPDVAQVPRKQIGRPRNKVAV